MKTSERNVWVLLCPAEDVPGEWMAHCLDFDVLAQGENPRHALELLFESIMIAVSADIAGERDPFDRRAPDSEWAPLWSIVNGGHVAPLDDIFKEESVSSIALQLTVDMQAFAAAQSQSVPRSLSTTQRSQRKQVPAAFVAQHAC